MKRISKSQRILILGAGPTGLGAAYRLSQLGHRNWVIYEKQERPGGLCSTFVDTKGFSWDVGGHVMFSANERYNSLVHSLLGKDSISHQRESWIRFKDAWVPYPFQNNIHRLGAKRAAVCLAGLRAARSAGRGRISNFRDWILASFGKGIADIFMLPYNSKMWRISPSRMSYAWIGERVSTVNLRKIAENVRLNRDDSGWGPNKIFTFPLYGGTGGLFSRFEPFIRDHAFYGMNARRIDLDSRRVTFDGGHTDTYNLLINTSPLDSLMGMAVSSDPAAAALRKKTAALVHTGIYVVGIGLKKKMEGTRCWVYFPEKDIPFYRMTYFSRYSPFNVPDGDTGTYSSLMCELSFSGTGAATPDEVAESVIRGLFSAGILSETDRDRIVSSFVRKVDYAYPVPTLARDKILSSVQPFLEHNDIYSRGRFGGWKYEIGNMDHSTVMGMELVERLMQGKKEKIWIP